MTPAHTVAGCIHMQRPVCCGTRVANGGAGRPGRSLCWRHTPCTAAGESGARPAQHPTARAGTAGGLRAPNTPNACTGTAVGKMRNALAVEMVRPFRETFQLASDEGPFHGGDASAPPPLALFAPPQLEIPC